MAPWTLLGWRMGGVGYAAAGIPVLGSSAAGTSHSLSARPCNCNGNGNNPFYRITASPPPSLYPPSPSTIVYPLARYHDSSTSCRWYLLHCRTCTCRPRLTGANSRFLRRPVRDRNLCPRTLFLNHSPVHPHVRSFGEGLGPFLPTLDLRRPSSTLILARIPSPQVSLTA